MSEDENEGLPETVDSEDARKIVAGRSAMVIDIRDPDEFAEERIFSAERLDPDDVTVRMDEVIADEDDKRDAFLIICSDGSASAELAEKLQRRRLRRLQPRRRLQSLDRGSPADGAGS